MEENKYISKGCEICAGIYGIKESDGIVRCPLCGAETIDDYRNFKKVE